MIVDQTNLGHQRVRPVPHVPAPARMIDPGKLAVRPDPEALHVPPGVVVPPHARVIDIPDAIQLIKVDEQIAVPDWNIPSHSPPG
jgi:hypothetical protein